MNLNSPSSLVLFASSQCAKPTAKEGTWHTACALWAESQLCNPARRTALIFIRMYNSPLSPSGSYFLSRMQQMKIQDRHNFVLFYCCYFVTFFPKTLTPNMRLADSHKRDSYKKRRTCTVDLISCYLRVQGVIRRKLHGCSSAKCTTVSLSM